MNRYVAPCVFFGCFGFTAQGDDVAPEKKIPELEVLNHYLGEWDTRITTKGFPFSTGTASAKKILDGRFIQQTGELRGEDAGNAVKITTLMTYDPNKSVYRSWTFLSDGNTAQSEGTWNEETKTMTFVSHKDDAGSSSTITADFSVANVETWKIVVKDRAGRVFVELRGSNTRRKK